MSSSSPSLEADIAVDVKNLHKTYQIYEQPSDRFKQIILPQLRHSLGLRPKNYYRDFVALNDVSFDIRRGETVGIIGFNGAGKSTLLQMICGTVSPTQGSINVNGRISALLELGSGFNGEFTGRENALMNCYLQGMSHEDANARLPDIEKFADIGEFIERPVKYYSSGMFARLAFSVAVHVDPDILIVDEALSVGDMAFQEKSITRMKDIRKRGTSILFVTHSVSVVRNFCDKALWIDNGTLKAYGERLLICDLYQEAVDKKNRNLKPLGIKGRTSENDDVYTLLDDNQSKESKKTLHIVSVTSDKSVYKMSDTINIYIKLAFHKKAESYGVGFIIYDAKGNIVSVLNTIRDSIETKEPKDDWTLTIYDNHFGPGHYNITVSISDGDGMFSYDRWDHYLNFEIAMERNSNGLATVEGIVRCAHEWK